MNDKKQLDCQLYCCATASLKDSIQIELLAEDRPLKDVLEENEETENEEGSSS